jgi:hypothetical protein
MDNNLPKCECFEDDEERALRVADQVSKAVANAFAEAMNYGNLCSDSVVYMMARTISQIARLTAQCETLADLSEAEERQRSDKLLCEMMGILRSVNDTLEGSKLSQVPHVQH